MRLKQIPQNAFSLGKETIEFVRDNKGKVGLGLIAIGTLGGLEWQFAHDSIPHLLDLMASGLLAFPTWELPTKHGLTELLQTAEGANEVLKWLAIDSLYTSAGGLLHKTVSRVLNEARDERLRRGLEAIPDKVIPQHVIIGGDASIVSSFAEVLVKSGKTKPTKKSPIVGVHLDDEIPPAFGQEMKYHLRAGSTGELKGRHAATVDRELSFVEAAGMMRAKQLTFICVDPNNAVYYGTDSSIRFSPEVVSSMIKRMAVIDEKSLEGKTINVIWPDEKHVGGTIDMDKDLTELSKRFKFTLNSIKPESLLMDQIESDLKGIAFEKKERNQPLNVVLTVEGKGERDRKMIERFKSALLKLKINNDAINIEVIRRDRLDREVPVDKTSDTVTQILKDADYILGYGDTDEGTSSIMRLLLARDGYNIPKEKLHAIVEDPAQLFDFDDGEEVILIYQMVLNRFTSVS